MFQIGDFLMKSPEGICHIDGIVSMPISDNEQGDFFRLVPYPTSGNQIYLSVKGTHSNIRPLMGPTEARKLLSEIAAIEVPVIDNDRAREQIYRDAIRSLDSRRIVGIIKHIHLRNMERNKQGKKPTSVDDRYCKLAEDALYSELEFVLKKRADDIRQLVRETILR